jgi:CTP:molybdopterin cytidylyltransferase MocA
MTAMLGLILAGGLSRRMGGGDKGLLPFGGTTMLDRIVAQLPTEFREVLLLREVEDLSYREIATVTGLPVGTVMSRLSRARALLRRDWGRETAKEGGHAV